MRFIRSRERMGKERKGSVLGKSGWFISGGRLQNENSEASTAETAPWNTLGALARTCE
jgi:hypothetical protein